MRFSALSLPCQLLSGKKGSCLWTLQKHLEEKAAEQLSIRGFSGHTASALQPDESNNIPPFRFPFLSEMQQVKLLIEFHLDFIKYS